MNCKKILAAVQKGIDKVNLDATSRFIIIELLPNPVPSTFHLTDNIRAQHIRKWTIIKTDFSVSGGELTPTMKLKRRIVNQKYSSEIEGMYFQTKL